MDGVYLDLHGAAMAASFPDVEGELLRRVRHVLDGVPVTLSLDPHANLTADMVDRCDAAVPYRTYPHVDMKETGARAMRLLLRRVAAGPFARAYRQLDYWMPITSQCTLVDPMRGVMAERALVAYADTADTANKAADDFLAYLRGREADFGSDILPARDAVAAAMQEPRGPVMIADTQDNPGGGGHGDTTGCLRN